MNTMGIHRDHGREEPRIGGRGEQRDDRPQAVADTDDTAHTAAIELGPQILGQRRPVPQRLGIESDHKGRAAIEKTWWESLSPSTSLR